jgi:hypothetical protein
MKSRTSIYFIRTSWSLPRDISGLKPSGSPIYRINITPPTLRPTNFWLGDKNRVAAGVARIRLRSNEHRRGIKCLGDAAETSMCGNR